MLPLAEYERSWVVLKVNNLGQEEGHVVVSVFTCCTDLQPVGAYLASAHPATAL